MTNRFGPASALAAAGLCLLVTTSAFAQDEARLKEAFEGRRVAMRMNMPGSASGVDVHAEAGRSINYRDYEKDLLRFGVAIYADDMTAVTLVKVKKDLIEFHLGGGGYGTFSDDTSTSSGIVMLDKSPREKDLEKLIRKENNRDRRRSMEYELRDMQERRERENRRRRAESDRIEARKREEIAARRLTGGSRFNIRYEKRVPENVHPEDIVAALREYIDFNPSSEHAPGNGRASGDADASALRKGMSRAQVEDIFGRPVTRKETNAGGLGTTTLTFEAGEQRVVAGFVEDVLVRYTVSSK